MYFTGQKKNDYKETTGMEALKKVIAFTGKSWNEWKSRGYIKKGKYVVVQKSKGFSPYDTVKFKVMK